jgi:hypothetical protein
MTDPNAMRRELPKLKAALTRAKNSGDPKRVIETVDHAFKRFEEIGWPDQWATWNIAREDALFALQRQLW